jgi:carboxypeptidase C (cathepsin A)
VASHIEPASAPSTIADELPPASVASLQSELLQTKEELATARRELAYEKLVYERVVKRNNELLAEQRKAVENEWFGKVLAAKREAQAQREQDLKDFEADRKAFTEYCREDMAKCELRAKRAELSTQDCDAAVKSVQQYMDAKLAKADAKIDTLESFLSLEQQAVAKLRYDLALKDKEVKALKAAAHERAAEALAGSGQASAAEELVALRAECKLLRAKNTAVETELETFKCYNKGLHRRLEESETKVKKLFDIESTFNPRLQRQATEIEILRSRLMSAGLSTMWDSVARTASVMSTPPNVVFRESDGPLQMGSGVRYATPMDK